MYWRGVEKAIGDFRNRRNSDAYQKPFDKLLRNLKVKEGD
jgi:hypothetical protein